MLKVHQEECDRFLAEPTFFTLMDTFPIELIFPVCQGRSEQQVGKKGRDKGRWSVGIKLCWLLNRSGQVVAWDWDAMNTCDKRFNRLVQPFIGQTIVLADEGFRDRDGIPENMKICKRGTWNERKYLETAFSLLTRVCGLKKILHRLRDYIRARLAYVAAMFNVLVGLFHFLHPHAKPHQMSIAEFAL